MQRRPWTRLLVGTVIALCTGGAEAHAQYRGQVAVGLGPAVVAPAEADTPAGPGLNGHLSFFLSHRWSVSIRAGVFRTGGDGARLRESFVGADFGLHFDLGRWHPFFQAGVHVYEVRFRAGPGAPWEKSTDPGLQFGVGLEYFLRPTLGLRLTLEGHDVLSDLDASFIELNTAVRFYF
ncbi:hypothetical protein HRbin11_01169 [bacterium HR11]|nr:hypothetical protein HRbin11_01169 [bacterium HR11]